MLYIINKKKFHRFFKLIEFPKSFPFICIQASEEELFSNLKTYLGRMLQAGTTLVEVKTGYGLDLETEVKMLKVIQRVIKDPSVAIDISVTYCAAHAVPQ